MGADDIRLVFIFCHYTCGLSWFIARHDVKVLRSCTGMKTAASQLRACSHKGMMQPTSQSPLGLDIVAGVYPGFCLKSEDEPHRKKEVPKHLQILLNQK